MHRAIVLLLAAAVSIALAVASGCNPIFGIVSRTAGPTWCEQDAQAGAAYCDDFDRVSTSTTGQETPRLFNGSLQVTDAASSSPPNSLEVTTVTVLEGGALSGNLVAIGLAGGMAMPFQCRVDIRTADVIAIPDGGSIAVAGVGGAVVPEKGAAPAPVLVFLLMGPSGITATLGSLGLAGGVQVIGEPCPLFNQLDQGTLSKDWLTLELDLIPADHFKAGPPCLVGEPKGHQSDRPDGAGLLAVQLGAIPSGVLVPPKMLIEPYFAYGIGVIDASPSLTLHLDNVACVVSPDGGIP